MASAINGGASHPAQGSPANPYMTPLEPSFLNTEPQDEFVREIADWIAFVSRGTSELGHRVYYYLYAGWMYRVSRHRN